MTNREDERIIEGMERQFAAREAVLAGAERLGWKSGFGTEGAMGLLEIRQPLVGFLTSATLIDSGSVVDVSEWAMPLIEPEVAVRLEAEVGPGASPEQAAEAIGAVAPAIELVDLGSIDSVADILAGNIFHRRVILGEFQALGDSALDAVRIAVTANGTKGEPSDPRQVIGDLGAVVAALADQADLAGARFEPGDIVITGAAVPPAPLQSGDSFEAELSGGSGIAVKIA
ncbi:MAG: fumarylacetoacetate hydrolase family protein [Solirubrobacterales bacterium]|nr:fumarylacetoacetate hydrolase family protein [Solirubrobacterales bacterium]